MSFFGSIGKFLFGDKGGKENIYSPEQNQLLQYLTQMAQKGPQSNPAYQGGQDYLQNLLSGDPGATEAFEAPYRQQFEGQVIPGIAERFAGMGAGNQSSSAFTNALGQAGGNYTTGLAALREGLKMQALPHALNYARAPFQDLANLAGIGLNRSPYQEREGSSGFLAPIAGALTGGISGGIGKGIGTGIGSGLGNIISDWFKSGNQKSQASTGLG